MTKRILKIIICAFFLISIFYCLSITNINTISSNLKLILLIIGNILFILSTIFSWTKFKSLCRLIYVVFILFCICVIVYTILYKLNVIDIFSSVTSFKNYIISTKEKGIFIYILIQALQVMFLPVPAAIICIVGSVVYGPLLGGLYCSIGVLLGSYISFFVGKIFGFRLVSWIAGVDNANKYSEIIRKKGGLFIFLAFLLPMFPDDILCLISGITNMKFKTFFIIALITRPIGVMFMSYFGGGHIIPFSGWGLYVWGLILIVAIVLVCLTYKYQDIFEKKVINKFFKKKLVVNHKIS